MTAGLCGQRGVTCHGQRSWPFCRNPAKHPSCQSGARCCTDALSWQVHAVKGDLHVIRTNLSHYASSQIRTLISTQALVTCSTDAFSWQEYAAKEGLHVVHTSHGQNVSSQAGARGMLHFHDWVAQPKGTYMSYTQVIARMYQASQVPWPPPRHLSEMAMTSRAADICTPACRNRARRPNLSAVQNETYVESCKAGRQSELRG